MSMISSFVFMPLAVAGDFFGLGDKASGLEIYTSDPQNISGLREMIAADLKAGLRAFDWLERNRSFINALRVERNVMFLILTLIILVAAFNIVSSMIMLVRSKNADIAVLRTMGASGGSIMRIFLMTGASIGLVGTVSGTVLGLLFCWKIGSIQHFIEQWSGAELFAAEIYFYRLCLRKSIRVKSVWLSLWRLVCLFLPASIRRGVHHASHRRRHCAMNSAIADG